MSVETLTRATWRCRPPRSSHSYGSYLDDEALAMMADAGTFLSLDLYDGVRALEEGGADDWPAETQRKLRESQRAAEALVGRATEAGVRIAYGTDSGVYPDALVGRQFAVYVRCGMSPLEAIRAATTTAAECLGWADRVGALGPGRFADLVAVDGDPLADVTLLERPVVVAKGGRVVRDERAA